MTTLTETINQFNKSALDSAIRAARIGVDGAERLASLQLQTAKNALEDSAQNAKALVEIKNFQDFAALRAQISAVSVEKTLEYSRQAYELAAQVQAEFSALIEENFTAIRETLVSAIDKAIESTPAGNEFAKAAVKSSVTATTAAVDSFAKAAKQMAGFADVSVKAAAAATAAAVRSATIKQAA